MNFDSRAKKRIREAKKKARPGNILIIIFHVFSYGRLFRSDVY